MMLMTDTLSGRVATLLIVVNTVNESSFFTDCLRVCLFTRGADETRGVK